MSLRSNLDESELQVERQIERERQGDRERERERKRGFEELSLQVI
jgi:hypothetical protein